MLDIRKKYPDAIVDEFEDIINRSHLAKLEVKIYGSDAELKETIIASDVQDNDVTIDRQSRPHRKATISIHRPNTVVGSSDLSLSDRWQLLYCVYISTLNTSAQNWQGRGWLKCPIFAGVLDSENEVASDGRDTYTISLTGFEDRYSQILGYPGKIYQKGSKITDVITDILDEVDDRLGTPKLKKNITPSSARLANEFWFGSGAEYRIKGAGLEAQSPWAAAKWLANALGNWKIYINAEFQLVLKPLSREAVIVCDKDNIIGEPSFKENTKIINRIVVVGAQKGETKTYIYAQDELGGTNKPGTLGRDYSLEIINSEIPTTTKCLALARSKLEDLSITETIDSLEICTNPTLEEFDYIRVVSGGRNIVVPLNTFNISTEQNQSISAQRKTKEKKKLWHRKRRLKK